jgi:hypothetical protein
MSTNDEQNWEAESTEVTRPVGTVVSVRFPRGIAEQIFELAERRGVPVSAVVREAVDAYLSGVANRTAATSDITVSGIGTVALVTGYSSHGRTVGAPTAFVDSDEPQLTLT